MNRAFYSDSIENFIRSDKTAIFGRLNESREFAFDPSQKDAWSFQIDLLKDQLFSFRGWLYFEYAIPRMGKRVDVVVLIGSVIFVIEFKVGEREYNIGAIDQVWDYALDLKNFHESSHDECIAPILIATKAKEIPAVVATTKHNDRLLIPIKSNGYNLNEIISQVLKITEGGAIDHILWQAGKYSPTPTIIEAAMALYNGHSVTEISRSDADAINLSETSAALDLIITSAKQESKKVICFVTGVPGAGKTLVGLDVATKHFDKMNGLTSVFLSGNGPLVAVLREALTRDKVKRDKQAGKKVKKGEVLSEVKVFVQNVHHFRDEALRDQVSAPFDHVAIFDEAQRAWNVEQTSSFMARKKGVNDFDYSEPEFLISYLNRHKDWAVVICLVGGGQEINTGEAGISEWVSALNRSFRDWHVYVSPNLTDSEYAAGEALNALRDRTNVFYKPELHLSVSLRSFRAENLSKMVKCILDTDPVGARQFYDELIHKYPLYLTRDINIAKAWLKEQARGNERFGMVVSSQAQRLKPLAIDVKSTMDPIHWFLDGKDDVRSSYYLEDVATEFHVQGLELDWCCVCWDGDLRFDGEEWSYHSFKGSKWIRVEKEERRTYLKNAYRVLLTRARQGMVICVPAGNKDDHTRLPDFYNRTYEYLLSCGIREL